MSMQRKIKRAMEAQQREDYKRRVLEFEVACARVDAQRRTQRHK